MIFDASTQLTPSKPAYQRALIRHVWEAYLEDVNYGDATTHFFVREKKRIVRAQIIARESGIFAGLLEAKWFLKKLKLRLIRHKAEGKPFRKGDILLVIEGRADHLLAAERTLLNCLQRLCGVATATQTLAAKLPKSIKLLATRKTLWGLMDKRAVHVGGGLTHRLNLNDAAMVKDNHFLLNPKGFSDLKRLFRHAPKLRFIEIEIDNLTQLQKFIQAYRALPKKFQKPKKTVVMLDNFSPIQIKKAVRILTPLKLLIEVSGGITLANIKRYAIKGVHAISSGAITNKAPAIDISLDIQA